MFKNNIILDNTNNLNHIARSQAGLKENFDGGNRHESKTKLKKTHPASFRAPKTKQNQKKPVCLLISAIPLLDLINLSVSALPQNKPPFCMFTCFRDHVVCTQERVSASIYRQPPVIILSFEGATLLRTNKRTEFSIFDGFSGDWTSLDKLVI